MAQVLAFEVNELDTQFTLNDEINEKVKGKKVVDVSSFYHEKNCIGWVFVTVEED